LSIFIWFLMAHSLWDGFGWSEIQTRQFAWFGYSSGSYKFLVDLLVDLAGAKTKPYYHPTFSIHICIVSYIKFENIVEEKESKKYINKGLGAYICFFSSWGIMEPLYKMILSVLSSPLDLTFQSVLILVMWTWESIL